jgi:hypothetical protein
MLQQCPLRAYGFHQLLDPDADCGIATAAHPSFMEVRRAAAPDKARLDHSLNTEHAPAGAQKASRPVSAMRTASSAYFWHEMKQPLGAARFSLARCAYSSLR